MEELETKKEFERRGCAFHLIVGSWTWAFVMAVRHGMGGYLKRCLFYFAVRCVYLTMNVIFRF